MFKIVSIELEGYKFFRLNQIEKISIKMVSIFQIILGKNGSGKSKLMKELSPLPANPSEFDKNGRKKIEILYNGTMYTLISDFSNKKPHEFWKGEENLNTGGTISVQKDLVRRELNYTEDMHQLMLNKIRFTDMPPAKRREFLQTISDSDVDYATGVYRKAQIGLRDVQGAIKELKQQLSKEMDKFSQLNFNAAAIKEETQSLNDRLVSLFKASDQSMDKRAVYFVEKMEYLNGKLATKAHELLKTITGFIVKANAAGLTRGPDDRSTYNAKFETKRDMLRAKEVTVDNLSSQHDSIMRIIGEINEAGTDNLDELKERLAKLDAQENALRERIKLFHFEGDVSSVMAKRTLIKQALTEALMDLPDNSDKRFSRARKAEMDAKLESINHVIMNSNANYESTIARLEHIKNTKDCECPKCHFVWIPGIAPNEVEVLERNAAIHLNNKNAALKDAEAVRDEINAILDYSSKYSKLKAIFDSNIELRNFMDYVLEDNRILVRPTQLTAQLNFWVSDLEIHDSIWKLHLEKMVVLETIKKIEAIDTTTNKSQLTEHLESIDKSIYNTTAEIDALSNEVKVLDVALSYLNRLTEQYKEYVEITRDIDVCYDNFLSAAINEEIDEQIRSTQVALSNRVNMLNQSNDLEIRIKSINENLNDLGMKVNAYKAIVDALSPVNGLIAKSMGGFINRFVEQLNVVIGSVYTYPLEVLPCAFEEDGMNYKFPLMVGEGEQMIADDISDGSDGQKEIIDFAFKLVATMFMGFDDYPLMLDEIGRPQDEVHRASLMNYIRALGSNGARQIFMVSHYASAHSGYGNADFIVLNSSNITAPANSNANVEITF